MKRFTFALPTAALALIFVGCGCSNDDTSEEGRIESRETVSVEDEVLQLYGPTATIVSEPISDAQTSWFGATHVTVNSPTQYGGWVDGNGPDRYAAFAQCVNNVRVYGPSPWAGDRRGSVASCNPRNILFKGFILIDL
jgi:hypothetical protein